MKRFAVFCSKNRPVRQLILPLLLFGCCLFFFLQGVSALSASTKDSYTASLRQAILRSAVHCYSIEGRYPESLAYLKEHYGIRWDETRYLVDYEIISSNLRPDVTIISLNPKEDS